MTTRPQTPVRKFDRVPFSCHPKPGGESLTDSAFVTIQTRNLIIATHLPRHLRALVRGVEEFENTAGLRVAGGIRAQLLSASPDFLTKLETAKQPDPWQFGFAIIHKIDNGACGSRATWTGKPARVGEPGGESINVLMGMCGFPGPPDEDGSSKSPMAFRRNIRAAATQPKPQ